MTIGRRWSAWWLASPAPSAQATAAISAAQSPNRVQRARGPQLQQRKAEQRPAGRQRQQACTGVTSGGGAVGTFRRARRVEPVGAGAATGGSGFTMASARAAARAQRAQPRRRTRLPGGAPAAALAQLVRQAQVAIRKCSASTGRAPDRPPGPGTAGQARDGAGCRQYAVLQRQRAHAVHDGEGPAFQVQRRVVAPRGRPGPPPVAGFLNWSAAAAKRARWSRPASRASRYRRGRSSSGVAATARVEEDGQVHRPVGSAP